MVLNKLSMVVSIICLAFNNEISRFTCSIVVRYIVINSTSILKFYLKLYIDFKLALSILLKLFPNISTGTR